MADSHFEKAGEALLRPELSPALEAVLELRALGFHGPASDRQPELGGTGIVHVCSVGVEVVLRVLDRGDRFRIRPWRVGQKVGKGLEQFSGRMVFQGVEDFLAPGARLVLGFREEFCRKGVQVLARVVEVERSDRALLEAIIEDVPQPYSAVHDNVTLPDPVL